jgi:hypothetical protein
VADQSIRERTARCACGAFTATARGEPAHVYVCACLECQKISGSAFTYAAIFPEDAVTIAGESRVFRHSGESGRISDHHFCPSCGSTLFFRNEGLPGRVGISAGCFADPDFPAPKTVYWSSRGHDWVTMPEGTKIVDRQ